jgi:hypothetical protein
VTINDQGAIPPDLRPDREPVAIGGVQPRSRSSRILNLALAAAVVVAIGGVAFAVGRGTAPASAATDLGAGGPRFGNGAFPDASGAPNRGGGFGAGGAAGFSIEGTVTAVDADSVMIETAAGQTIELSIDASTEYHQQEAAEASDVTTGSTVIVQTDGFAGRGQGGPGSSAPPSSGTGPGATAIEITVVP